MIERYKYASNFLDGFILTHEETNLKIVIEIQNIELKLVAFYFVATPFNTA
jgi:hypothetical protein